MIVLDVILTELQAILAACAFVAVPIVTFFTTKHKMKEYMRDKIEGINERLHQLDKAQEQLKAKDELQQTIIETFNDNLNRVLDNYFKNREQ